MESVLLLLMLLAGLPVTSPAQTAPGFHLTRQIHVGGEGGWDYLSFDAARHRLYVSHAMRVMVVDPDSGTVVGEIPKTEGVHGIAIADDLGKGFISNGRSSSVTVFDLKTLAVRGTVSAGQNPDASLYDPFSHRVFAFNGRSHDATVIDAVTDSVIATLPLGGKPEFAVSDGAGRLFVNIEDKSEIAAIDPVAAKVLARWSVAPGEEPSGLAIDIAHHRLFAVCGNKLMAVVDDETGALVATVPIGSRVDGCAFDPALGYAFSSNGEGTVTVVREESPAKFSVVETVPTRPGARTITIDPATHTLYLPTAEFGPAPAPTADQPHPRPSMVPDSFVILQVQPGS